MKVLKNEKRPIDQLTAKEKAIAQLIRLGKQNNEIAIAVGLCPKTIARYITRIFDKVGCWSRVELAMYVKNHEEAFNILPLL